MALHHVDIESALRRLADRRIEEAMEQGKFDNLPGMGLPLELDEPPADENAKLTWWALRILKQNNFTPHEVQWRKQIDLLTARLEEAKDEPALVDLVGQINKLAHAINTLGTNAIALPIARLDMETELHKFRARRGKP